MDKKQYMVIEHFKNKDPVPAYRRFRERAHMAPEGLAYVSSWIDEKIERCYIVMETHERSLLDQWIANWSDIVDFEVHPVMTTQEVLEKLSPRL